MEGRAPLINLFLGCLIQYLKNQFIWRFNSAKGRLDVSAGENESPRSLVKELLTGARLRVKRELKFRVSFGVESYSFDGEVLTQCSCCQQLLPGDLKSII